MISTREAIGIAELCIYIPLLFISSYLTYRHGFFKQLAWLFLALFCTLRAASGGLAIASSSNPTNITEAVWTAILGSIGLNPLLLATMGLLKRVYAIPTPLHLKLVLIRTYTLTWRRNEHVTPKPALRITLLRLLHLICTTALVLCIVGGVDLTSTNLSTAATGKTLARVGIIIFLISFVDIVLLAVWTIPDARKIPIAEKRIFYAVLATFPFLTVRLIYSIISDFDNSKRFSIFNGDAVVQLCMSILEELVVVLLYIASGLMAPPVSSRLSNQDGGIENGGGLSQRNGLDPRKGGA
jgi:hypothetical protein